MQQKHSNVKLARLLPLRRASIIRGRPPAASSRDPDLREIIRAVPELYYCVPDDLDKEIWEQRGHRWYHLF